MILSRVKKSSFTAPSALRHSSVNMIWNHTWRHILTLHSGGLRMLSASVYCLNTLYSVVLIFLYFVKSRLFLTVSSNPRCNICCITFRTHRGLLRHNAVIHKQLPTDPSGRPFIQNNPSIPLGFGDLAFIDFSCQKFPQIAQVKTCKIHQMRNNYFIYLFYFFFGRRQIIILICFIYSGLV